VQQLVVIASFNPVHFFYVVVVLTECFLLGRGCISSTLPGSVSATGTTMAFKLEYAVVSECKLVENSIHLAN
jgi:hypothetical protein